MEKHHKLRRPVGASTNGCNICGKDGHQAAYCVNGTVNWKIKFPEGAFAVKPTIPLFWDKRPPPDYKQLAIQAKAFAAAREAAEAVDFAKIEAASREIAAAAGPSGDAAEADAAAPMSADDPPGGLRRPREDEGGDGGGEDGAPSKRARVGADDV